MVGGWVEIAVGVVIVLVAVRGLMQVRHTTEHRMEQRRQKGRPQYRLDASGHGVWLTVAIDLCAMATGVLSILLGVTYL